MLFATLDPTMRLVRLPGGLEAILSDTVGFISDLPTDLVAAFRATLEEVVEADLILHVRDIANPDSESQRQDVLDILADLGLEAGAEEPMLEALNKIDCLTTEQQQVVRERAARKPEVLACSALTGEGLPEVLQAVEARLVRDHKRVELTLGPEEGAAIAWLHEHGRVLERREVEGKTHMSISLSPAALARFEQRYGGQRKAAAE
jgi:GTP-binding protein HflX